MSRSFDRGSSEYLDWSGTDMYNGLTHASWSVWAKLDSTANNMDIFTKWWYDGGSGPYYGHGWLLMWHNGNNGFRFEWSYIISAEDSIQHTGGATTNQWYHIGARWAPTFRDLWVDGVQVGTDVDVRTSLWNSDSIDICIGTQDDHTNYWDGDVAEAVSWQAFLSDGDMVALSQGKAPWNVRPKHIIGMWLPFGDRADADYGPRGLHMSAHNTPAHGEDPLRITNPWRGNPQRIGRSFHSHENPLWVGARPMGYVPTAPTTQLILTTYGGYSQPVG